MGDGCKRANASLFLNHRDRQFITNCGHCALGAIGTPLCVLNNHRVVGWNLIEELLSGMSWLSIGPARTAIVASIDQRTVWISAATLSAVSMVRSVTTG
jgi:hypothetical protein